MHIDLKLGLSCNNACIHCVMEPVRKRLIADQMPLDSAGAEISSLLESVLRQNVNSITLTGG